MEGRQRIVGAAFALVALAVATAGATPNAITGGPDGNVWFTESDQPTTALGDRVGVITPAGAVKEFSAGIRSDAPPGAITAGPDGKLWFIESGWSGARTSIGRITPTGRITRFFTGMRPNAPPEAITAGPDGNLWFVEHGGIGARASIGRMTPTGRVTRFFAGISPDSSPSSIAPGPDGNLWFTEPGEGPFLYPIPPWDDVPVGRIGRITPAGRVTQFSKGISTFGWPDSIAAGADGNLWFTEPYLDRIGRITPTGVVTEFSRGIGRCSRPGSITAGPDGNLWFTAPGADDWDSASPCHGVHRPGHIGRITPSGVVTEFRAGIGPADLPQIVSGPDGNLWFTEPGRNAVARITTTGVVSEFPPAVQVDRVRVAGTRGVSVRVRCTSCRGVVRLFSDGVVGTRRFSAREGHAARLVVPLSPHGRRLLAARGRLPVLVRVQTQPYRLLGAKDGRSLTLRDPAAVRGTAVNLPATPALKADLRAAHLAGRPRSDWPRTRGPIPGSVYYARLNAGEWALANFWNPGTGFTDSLAVFNRPRGGRWLEIGDTWNPCESQLPRPVLAAWHFEDCE